MPAPLNLSGEHYTLARPTLQFGVCEVRYDGDKVDLALGYEFQDDLVAQIGGSWNVDHARWQDFHIDLSEEGPRQEMTEGEGVRLSNTVLGAEISVFPDRAFVQVNRYSRWSESFKPLLEVTLRFVGEHLKPVGRSRLGLRYVNRFNSENAKSPDCWRSRLEHSLLGAVASGPFADQVIQTQNQLVLQLDAGVQATIRHGVLDDTGGLGTFVYLLDIDTYDITSARFECDDVLQRVELLNRNAAELYRRSLQNDYAINELGMRPIEPKGENAR